MAAACCVEPERRGPISSVRSSSRFHAQSLVMAATRTCVRAESVAGSAAPGAGVSARTPMVVSRAVTAIVEAKRWFMMLGPDMQRAMIAQPKRLILAYSTERGTTETLALGKRIKNLD